MVVDFSRNQVGFGYIHMDNLQALQTVYNAARLAPLNANDHELIRKAAEQVAEALKPKDDGKVVEMPKGS